MKISEINVYPVKSLAGIAVEEALVERRGLEFDRRWMLVDDKGKFLTQREFPKMATISVSVDGDGLRFADGENSLSVPLLPEVVDPKWVKIWASRCRALLYGPEINSWFGESLGADVALAVMPEDTKRRVSFFYAVQKDDHVSFADGYPFLLAGQSSLDDLNSRLDEKVPMNRFRPNIVFEGGEPFAESNWKKLRIGETIFHNVKPCARCVMTTIDQENGVKTGAEPLKTLASYRTVKRAGKSKVLFGENLIAEEAGGRIRVGDEVEILEMKKK